MEYLLLLTLAKRFRLCYNSLIKMKAVDIFDSEVIVY